MHQQRPSCQSAKLSVGLLVDKHSRRSLRRGPNLGHSVIFNKTPTEIVQRVDFLLKKPDLLQAIAENGKQRMGEIGAAKSIASHLLALG